MVPHLVVVGGRYFPSRYLRLPKLKIGGGYAFGHETKGGNSVHLEDSLLFRDEGLGFGVWGLGFGVWDLGFGVCG